MATAKKTTDEPKADDVKAAPVVEETRLDTDVHAPATNAPGDAPADTTDPTERASTISPQAPSPEALAAGTILGAVPVPDPVLVRSDVADGDVRVEEYEQLDARGLPVRVRHILDGPDKGKTIRIE
jgi:hypothetical protein